MKQTNEIDKESEAFLTSRNQDDVTRTIEIGIQEAKDGKGRPLAFDLADDDEWLGFDDIRSNNILTEDEYNTAITIIEKVMDAKPGSKEFILLDRLAEAVSKYDELKDHTLLQKEGRSAFYRIGCDCPWCDGAVGQERIHGND